MPGSPDADTPSVRICVQARLAHEGYRVEEQLTAAVKEAVIPSSPTLLPQGEKGAKNKAPL
ncbi:hypothetical protein, partial [Aeromonas caviae]|uniref:hypothetical protein n=1 Tax=Aeromonas caviae TaxID=648 RepID=UPI001FC7C5B4